MFIHCANGWAHRSLSGDLHNYMPDICQSAEVEDLWYERRKGPDEREKLRSRVYGAKIASAGHYSALCHVKFRKESVLYTGSLPDDAFPPDRLMTNDGSPSTWREILQLQPAINSSQSARLIQYLNLDAEHQALVMTTVTAWLYRDGRMFRDVKYEACFLARTSGSGESRKVWYKRKTGSDYKRECSKSEWSRDTIMRDTVLWFQTVVDTYRDWPQSYSSKAKYVGADVSLDTAILLARQAQVSALRYNDMELVDYSVGRLVGSPWAFQNTDFIVGRASAYANALDDIPIECENNLQNIVMILSMLEMIAFNSSELFTKWCDFQGFNINFQKLNAKNWYRSNKYGLTRLQVLARRFRAEKAALLDRTCIDEFLEVKRKDFGEASSAWLQGRYVFSTSVMDLGQAWNYWYDQALRWIGKRSDDRKIHGKVELEFGTFQCTALTREKALQGIVKAFELAYRHGLEPNAYVLWDLVPFSFVVDWFCPIGDAFHGYCRSTHFTPELWEYVPHYDGSAMCYSTSYVSQSPYFGELDVYTRWYEPSPPHVEPAYILRAEQQKARIAVPYSYNSASAERREDIVSNVSATRQRKFRRNAKRTVDAIALFL